MNARTAPVTAPILASYSTQITPSKDFSGNWEKVLSLFLSETDTTESSKYTYRRSLSHFFVWIEKTGRTLQGLQRADIVEYKNDLQRESLSANTMNGYLVAVRQFYTWTESRLLYPNIATSIKISGRRNKFEKQHLSEVKIGELLDYYRTQGNGRDYAIVSTMLRTGLRTIEIARLQVKDITIKGDKRVLLIRGKGHAEKDRFVILSPRAYAPIRGYLESRGKVKGEEALFANTSHNIGYYKTTQKRDNLTGLLPDGLTTRTISGIVKRGLVAIGLDSADFTAHSLRHTTAVELLRKGADISAVQEVLRHASIDTTKIYLESFKEEHRLQTATEELLDNAF